MTQGLRLVMEIAGVDSDLIDWSSIRRQRVEDVLEGRTYKVRAQAWAAARRTRLPEPGLVGSAGDPP